MNILVIPILQAGHPKIDFLGPVHFLSELSQKHTIIGIERIPYFGTSNNFLKYVRLSNYLMKVLILSIKQKKNIDLIYSMHPAFGLMGAIISKFINIPLIWDTNQGNLLAHCILLKTSFLFTWLHLIIEKVIGKIASIIVVPSERDLQLYIKQKFKYVNKIVVIPYGINLSFVDSVRMEKEDLRKKLKIDIDKRVLIFTGKRDYLPNKEAAFWINDELAPILAKESHDVQIIIFGSGEVPKHVHPIVTFPGFVPNVYEYIHASDICIVPYNLDTGISMKVIDAMACAKPVITMFSVARLFDNLTNGVNIIIANNRKDFIEKTLWMLNNHQLAKKIGLNARLTIEQYYDLKVITERWHDLLDFSFRKYKSNLM